MTPADASTDPPSRYRERYVTYDRWDAEHARLRDRLDVLEDHCEDLGKRFDARSQRTWTILLAVLTGLVLPLLVLAIVAVLSARGLGQ